MSADADPPRVEVRLYGDLGWFASEADRHGVARPATGAPRSIKDLIESLGVPHVEVGAILADGEPVGFDAAAAPGTRFAVYPPTRQLTPRSDLRPPPPDPRRFVADVHLGTLARRLRLLGFDTWYATDADDAALARRAADTPAILLSRDRQLLMRRIVDHGYCPRSSDPDEQLREVVDRYDLVPRAAPFTRCAECNAPLERVPATSVWERLPPRTRREHEEVARCTGCDRLFWAGSHVDALSERFAALLGDVRRRG